MLRPLTGLLLRRIRWTNRHGFLCGRSIFLSRLWSHLNIGNLDIISNWSRGRRAGTLPTSWSGQGIERIISRLRCGRQRRSRQVAPFKDTHDKALIRQGRSNCCLIGKRFLKTWEPKRRFNNSLDIRIIIKNWSAGGSAGIRSRSYGLVSTCRIFILFFITFGGITGSDSSFPCHRASAEKAINCNWKQYLKSNIMSHHKKA